MIILFLAAVSIAKASLYSGAEEVILVVNKVFIINLTITDVMKKHHHLVFSILCNRFAASQNVTVWKKLSHAHVTKTQAFR